MYIYVWYFLYSLLNIILQTVLFVKSFFYLFNIYCLSSHYMLGIMLDVHERHPNALKNPRIFLGIDFKFDGILNKWDNTENSVWKEG